MEQHWTAPNTLAQSIKLLTCIKVFSSNLGQDTEVFCGFPQSIQANTGTVPSVRQTASFHILSLHYSFINLSVDAMHSELLTESLNNGQQ
jgi:hypothetical protein